MKTMEANTAELSLERKYEIALAMLAEWSVAVETNGTGWDDWDEYYKDVSYRPSLIRNDLDEAIHEARKLFRPEDYGN